MIRNSIIASAALLAACSSGGDSADNAATPATDSSATAPAPAAADPNATFASLTGDAARGKSVFVRCAACHAVVAAKNGVGPSLHGVVGREAGQVAGFNYSPANKNSHLTWTGETLFTYLENPRKAMPGTKMSYAGLAAPQERADLIAYLATLK